MSQTIQERNRGGCPILEIQDVDHIVSWQVRVRGSAALRIADFKQKVSVNCLEYSPVTGVTKSTSIDLEEDAARALYLFLRRKFEPANEQEELALFRTQFPGHGAVFRVQLVAWMARANLFKTLAEGKTKEPV